MYVTVVSVNEVVALDDRGRAAPIIRVVFKVGDHGPFVEQFPKKDFDSMQIRQRLEDFALQLHRLVESPER